jgi:hypothetical protein
MSEPPAVATPAGWLVVDPAGHIIDSGPQTVTEASADAGEET